MPLFHRIYINQCFFPCELNTSRVATTLNRLEKRKAPDINVFPSLHAQSYGIYSHTLAHHHLPQKPMKKSQQYVVKGEHTHMFILSNLIA